MARSMDSNHAVAPLGDGFEGKGVDEGLFGGAGRASFVEEGLERLVEGGGVFDIEHEE
jgi:hypothetical protein